MMRRRSRHTFSLGEGTRLRRYKHTDKPQFVRFLTGEQRGGIIVEEKREIFPVFYKIIRSVNGYGCKI